MGRRDTFKGRRRSGSLRHYGSTPATGRGGLKVFPPEELDLAAAVSARSIKSNRNRTIQGEPRFPLTLLPDLESLTSANYYCPLEIATLDADPLLLFARSHLPAPLGRMVDDFVSAVRHSPGTKRTVISSSVRLTIAMLSIQ